MVCSVMHKTSSIFLKGHLMQKVFNKLLLLFYNNLNSTN